MVNLRCVFSGAWLIFALSSLPTLADCKNHSFPDYWKQQNLHNTRQLVLERDGKDLDWFFYSNKAFKINSGTWKDAWTGEIHFHAKAKYIEIDHVIPVCFARRHGASGWTDEKRKQFYNDMSLLIVTHKKYNSSKSDNPPWIEMPIKRSLACSYVEKFRAGLNKYDLEMSDKEWHLLDTNQLVVCETFSLAENG